MMCIGLVDLQSGTFTMQNGNCIWLEIAIVERKGKA